MLKMRNMNKKAQFFAIYLVLLTLFMCGMAMWIYYMQNKEVYNSLASPTSLLDLQDKQELFDLQERNIAIVSANESGLTENGDINAFKTNFIDYVMKPEQEQFRDFIFTSLTVDGKPRVFNIDDDAKKRDFLENTVYDFTLDNDNKNLKIERKHLGKTFSVKAPDKSVINFIVFADYSYDKNYLISFKEIEDFTN